MEKLVLIFIFVGLLSLAIGNTVPVFPNWLDPKIVNGEDADLGAHPHQVALLWTFFGASYFLCGGSVISENVVLTAAHCVVWDPNGEWTVAINAHKLSELGTSEDVQVIRVRRVYAHEQYIGGADHKLRAYPHDVAILMLEEPIVDRSTIINMADIGETFVNETCVISGWGRNDTNAPVVDTLQDVNITVISKEQCDVYWGQYYDMFPGQICLFNGEDPETGASACNGDSGGPLVCDGKLAGVTSWGVIGCRHPETGLFWPSVYASVSYYRLWIETTLQRFSMGRG